MSGISGVFMRRGEPADAGAAARMAAAAAHRATDGSWTWQDGPFFATRQQTFCTPEDALERSPVGHVGARAVLLFDGRLDNRDELADCLGLNHSETSVLSDADLALRVWLRWRHETPSRLLGDFAFVMWDGAARQAFCATDPCGVRPLHYYLSDTVLVFATELRQLVAHPLVPRRADEQAVGELLCGDPRTQGRTLYDDLRRLPHAHALSVSAGSSRLARYWRPDCRRAVPSRNANEYATAFREAFDRSVSVRLRSAGPVAAHLSGGLDSSSVLVTAAEVEPRRNVTAFSILFGGAPDADERAYIDAVLRHVPVKAVRVSAPVFDASEVRAQVHRRQYLPDFPNTLVASALRRAMASRGMRVSLTGSGGDLGLSGSYFHYADLLRHGRLVAFARRYLDVARSPEHGWARAELLRGAVWPLMPSAARRLFRPLARRLTGLGVPSWIEPAFARRAGLTDLPQGTTSPPDTLAAATVAGAYDGGLMHLVHDLYELGSSEHGIYDRHPFLDRRLIELLVSLPDEQRWRDGRMKFVLRQAMGPRLPAVVRERSDHTKSDFSHLTVEALAGLGGRAFFERLCIERRGWTRRGTLPSLYDRMERMRQAGDLRYRDLGWQLWSAAAIELWYAGVFETPTPVRTSWNSGTTLAARRQETTPVAQTENPIGSLS
jgi:asparagine synthase (glutamine-hydrolysing)